MLFDELDKETQQENEDIIIQINALKELYQWLVIL